MRAWALVDARNNIKRSTPCLWNKAWGIGRANDSHCMGEMLHCGSLW